MRQFFRRIAGCEGGVVKTERFVEIWNAVVVLKAHLGQQVLGLVNNSGNP